jgi:hypothetical protein
MVFTGFFQTKNLHSAVSVSCGTPLPGCPVLRFDPMQWYNLAPTLGISMDIFGARVQSPQLTKQLERDGIDIVHDGLGVKWIS